MDAFRAIEAKFHRYEPVREEQETDLETVEKIVDNADESGEEQKRGSTPTYRHRLRFLVFAILAIIACLAVLLLFHGRGKVFSHWTKPGLVPYSM